MAQRYYHTRPSAAASVSLGAPWAGAAQAHAKSVVPPAHPHRAPPHRAPIEPRHSMAQGQVKTSGFTYKEAYDLFNQQLSLC